MTSGFSSVLLNQFSEKGADVLLSMTPWTMIKDAVNISRYSNMEQPYGKDFEDIAFSPDYGNY